MEVKKYEPLFKSVIDGALVIICKYDPSSLIIKIVFGARQFKKLVHRGFARHLDQKFTLRLLHSNMYELDFPSFCVYVPEITRKNRTESAIRWWDRSVFNKDSQYTNVPHAIKIEQREYYEPDGIINCVYYFGKYSKDDCPAIDQLRYKNNQLKKIKIEVNRVETEYRFKEICARGVKLYANGAALPINDRIRFAFRRD